MKQGDLVKPTRDAFGIPTWALLVFDRFEDGLVYCVDLMDGCTVVGNPRALAPATLADVRAFGKRNHQMFLRSLGDED